MRTCAGEPGRTGTGGDQQEPDQSHQPCLRRRPDADLHADAARFVPAISRVENVRRVTARLTDSDSLISDEINIGPGRAIIESRMKRHGIKRQVVHGVSWLGRLRIGVVWPGNFGLSSSALFTER